MRPMGLRKHGVGEITGTEGDGGIAKESAAQQWTDDDEQDLQEER